MTKGKCGKLGGQISEWKGSACRACGDRTLIIRYSVRDKITETVKRPAVAGVSGEGREGREGHGAFGAVRLCARQP